MAAVRTFDVRNIDCALCAARIEHELKAVEGVEEAVLDYARLTLYVKANDPDDIPGQVRRIEPGVEVVPKDEISRVSHAKGDRQWVKRELALLMAAVALFVLHLIWVNKNPGGLLARMDFVFVGGAYFLAGWRVWQGAYRTLARGAFFDENVLMVIATVGALIIGAYSEGVAVMVFYKIGELLQEISLHHSRRSIESLLAAKPEQANVIREGGLSEVSPESVGIGEQILVRPGEKIPLDGEVISGNSRLDTSVLTGESIPVAAKPGDPVLAGQVNQTGALTIRVTRVFGESSIAKVMALVEGATARKAKTERLITTFARYYTPAVVFLAAAVATLPPLLTSGDIGTWIYRALVLLVISCPCALMVSVPLGYFGGIGKASRHGILVKGANFIDALAAVDTVIFDKTGTLTRGVFALKEVVGQNGFSKDQILEYAAAAEHLSTHPIAAAILAAFAGSGGQLDIVTVRDHVNMAGEGVKTRYGGRWIMVGNDNMLHRHGIEHQRCDFDETIAHVVVDDTYAGYVIIGDEIRPEAHEAISRLRQQGIKQVMMLTGDSDCPAGAVASRLKLDGYHAGLLPEDKVRVLTQIRDHQRSTGMVAFVGDGINDAPVIARADVGVAMGAMGSDAAIETADVVLMADSPAKLADAVAIARQTRRIVTQNIALVFVIKAIFIGLGAMGLASMWQAVFADMGTALLALANASRIMGRQL